MEYMTVKEAGQLWRLGSRIVTLYCAENRIKGAQKRGNLWLIPKNAERPVDKRFRKNTSSDKASTLKNNLSNLFTVTALPMPSDCPDTILRSTQEEQQRLAYQAEIFFLRGDFSQTINCYSKAGNNDAARLRISQVAITAAVSMGDYKAYSKIETDLNHIIKNTQEDVVKVVAEFSIATAAVGMLVLNMVPDWLKNGQMNTVLPQLKPNTLHLRARYFQCLKQYDMMLSVAQTAFSLSTPEQGITMVDLYLRIACAVACHGLGQKKEAREWLLSAMRLALPHGFITVIAEPVTLLGGLVEQCLEQEFPNYYSIVLKQWESGWKNWITFHNQFTKDNLSLVLSLREYHLATQVARRIPYAEIAKEHCISVGRLKNIMLEIYEKLYISGRNELVKYIVT